MSVRRTFRYRGLALGGMLAASLPVWARAFEDPPLPDKTPAAVSAPASAMPAAAPAGAPAPTPMPAPPAAPTPAPAPVPPPVAPVDPGAPASGATLQNEFIRVITNEGPLDLGRFAIETTGGNPEHQRDDRQPMLYGRPRPWTGFTTIRIDGQNWAFGGATKRRAGKGMPSGEIFQAPTLMGPDKERELVTICGMGGLKVTQRLRLIRSATTKMKDAVLVTYELENLSPAPIQGGVRLLLDTMLGSNDGAPLRAGNQAIGTEAMLRGGEVPDFWQAFDNLKSPAVVIEGVLREDGLTTPDALALANWGTLADNPWDFQPVAGRGFQREGESAMDSALALYFDPAPIAPGGRRIIRTQFGVGGITTAPGDLAIGLTAKSEIAYHPTRPQDVKVVAYVENTSGFHAKQVTVALSVTGGLSVQGDPAVVLEDLAPGQVKSAAFVLRANGSSFQPQKLTARVQSENFEENKAERDLTILDPPQVKLSLNTPASLKLLPDNTWEGNPFPVRLIVDNPTVWDLKNLKVSSQFAAGLEAPAYEAANQTIARLAPGAKETLDLLIRATGRAYGPLDLNFHVEGPEIPRANAHAVVQVPPQEPRLRIRPQEASYKKGDYIFFDVALEGMPGMTSGEAEVSWNTKTLRLVRESEGTLNFFEGIAVSGKVGKSEKDGKWAIKSSSKPFTGNDTIIRLHFKALSQNPEICVKGKLSGSDNKVIPVAPEHCLQGR